MELEWRISKYNPIYRNENGAYTKDEWTSYSDIGRIYEESVFTKEEYLETEGRYIKVITEILRLCNTQQVVVIACEKFTTVQTKALIYKKMLENDPALITIFENFELDKVYSMDEMKNILILNLRECVWSRLLSDNGICEIGFGYDYYAYVGFSTFDLPLKQINESIFKNGLFIG
ncbi:hypothetical protein QNI16_28270 [Cytophagaceae bacterium YF14B1]|uniref:Uncharacterized protein n=1 Tax=Xanthocytophaga flava TaxID=3048013 RepID=A0AAE3UA78_9BACT|nr:hypothetical protein [Xanthocytophaga flavus]MDJ1484427.1 hypothetical protein [Xanthocytophaga flavus]